MPLLGLILNAGEEACERGNRNTCRCISSSSMWPVGFSDKSFYCGQSDLASDGVPANMLLRSSINNESFAL